MNKHLLALALIVLVLAPALSADASTDTRLSASVETYNVTLTVIAVNQTLSLAANSTYTIDITLPSNWTHDDIQAVHFIANGITNKISLTALDANNTQLTTATVTPLSTGYHITLPPETSKIQLSSSAAANATITVVLESDPVKFELTLNKTSITLHEGESSDIGVTVKQVAGPAVYTWFTADYNSPLTVKTYYLLNGAKIEWTYSNAITTTGTGWTGNGLTTITWKSGEQGSGKTSVKLYLWAYAGSGGVNPERAQLVAAVTLSGSITDGIANLAVNNNINAKSLGIGIVIALIIAIVVLKTGLLGGRRGTTDPRGIIILLILIAAFAFAAGLVDVQTRLDIDPKMIGIGILAVLALVMMIRQGMVPAPRVVKKLFK